MALDTSPPSPASPDSHVELGDLRIPAQQWSEIYLQGKKVGYGRIFVAQREDGYEFDLRYAMPYLNMDQMQRVWLNADLSLRRMTLAVNAGESIRFEGRVVDGELRGAIESGNQQMDRAYALKGPVYVAEILPLVQLSEAVPVGESRVRQVFRPDSWSMATATVETLSLDPDATPPQAVLRTEMAGSVSNSTWTLDGEFITESGTLSGFAFTSRAVPREAAMEMPAEARDRLTQMELLQAARVDGGMDIERPRKAAHMTVLVGPLEREGVWNDGRRQYVLAVEGNQLKMRIEPVDVPAAGDRQHPHPADADLARWREPSLLIESDAPEMVARAREIVAEATDPWEMAVAIHEYVYRNMDRRELRSSFPSALEVLHSLKGDCNEHAALFAGLGRAAGLAVKPVGGVLYLNYGDDRSGFYYHAWNEVALETPQGLLWVAMDSTVPEQQADATHIKLVEGDLDQQAAIGELIGRLSIQVLDVQAQDVPH